MSASQIVGGIAGVIVGYVTQNPQLGFMTYAAVSGVGAYLEQPDRMGPRLEDLRVQMSQYGATIPFEWGTNRHAGTIIWPRILEAVEHREEESAKGGPDNVTFKYTLSCAVLVCEGPIAGIRRIWANKKIVYDVSEANTGPTQDLRVGAIRFYLGTEDQGLDPLIEATDGAGPAYRGYAYVVFEGYDVTDLNGRPPQWEFEVIQNGGDTFEPKFYKLDDIPAGTVTNYQSAYDSELGTLWVHNGKRDSIVADTGGATDGSCINVYDLAARTKSSVISVGTSDVGDLVYGPERRRVFGGGEYVQSQGGFVFNAVGLSLESEVLFSQVVEGGGWVPRPGTLAYCNGGWLLAASSSSHVGTGICLWNPETGAFARTGDLDGWWKTQALTLSDHRVALLSSAGVIVVIADPTFAYTLYPSAMFGGEPTRIAEDISRKRLLVATAGNAWSLDVESGVATKISEFSGGITIRAVAHDPRSDRHYIAVAGPVGVSPELLIVEPNSLAIENTVNMEPMTDTASEILLSPVEGEIALVGHHSVWLLSGLHASITRSTAPLSTIVSDICNRAGLGSDDIDVTELTDLVDGYIVPRQMTARAAIEPLQQTFFFDAVESDDKIKFVKRGKAAATLIPMEDRAAHEHGQDVPDALTITRAFELELPVQCDIEYPDIEADHLVGNQSDRRITKDTKHNLNLQLPIVMTAEKAKAVARTLLYEAWQNQSYKFSTSRKYAHLEPTSLVELPTPSAMYRGRITAKRERPGGVIEWEARVDAVDVYTLTGEGATPTGYVSQPIFQPGATIVKLLDAPILRDADNNDGFYDAMGGTTTTWRGAQLLKSVDEGNSYFVVHSTGTAASIGIATTALPDFTDGNIFDHGSSVTVRLQCGPALTSVDETALLNGANTALIGTHSKWEVIQFLTATLTAPGTYTLTGLLRGRRGTEWAMDTHAVGDDFVLASQASWNRVADGDINLERLYKAVTSGSTTPEGPVRFTNKGVGLKPFSPVDFRAESDASGNVVMHWNRRTRLIVEPLNKAAPLGESVEAYEVDILDGSTVKRTLKVASPTATYPVAQHIADFGAIQSNLNVAVYQLSSAVGRGTGLAASTAIEASGSVGGVLPVVGIAIDGMANYTMLDVTLTIPGHTFVVGQSLRLDGMEKTELWHVDRNGRSFLKEKEFGAILNNTSADRETYTVGSVSGDTVVLNDAVKITFAGGEDAYNNSFYIIWGAYLAYSGGGIVFGAPHADGTQATYGGDLYGGGSGSGTGGGGSTGGGGTDPTPTPTPTHADHDKLSANTLVSSSALIDRLQQ